MTSTLKAYRGRILHFLDDPYDLGHKQAQSYEYFLDGLLMVENGHVLKAGEFKQLASELPAQTIIEHYPNHLIMPGFIDTHIHYPQTQMIGAYGEQLLTWLNQYTFPTEQTFANDDHAAKVSKVFINELLRNGTTTALVFGTVHKNSVEAFFTEAQKRQLRMIAGKVLMDRNAPEALCDTPKTGYADSKALIERWHNVDRLLYAVTPRFAPTSSPEQLAAAAQLLNEFPDVYLHTHLSENLDEIAWVKSLFPESQHYLDVYYQAGLVRSKSVFAHGVHLCDGACQQLANNNAAIAHCPTSNLFLGSGLFNLEQAKRFGIDVGLGTDVGAGTSFSMFKTMDEAYKIQQLQKGTLDPFSALYMATLGGAKALKLDNKIGNFTPGKEADFMIADLAATPLIDFRLQYSQSLSDLLFVLNTLGDDRLILKTFALGRCVHNRDGNTL